MRGAGNAPHRVSGVKKVNGKASWIQTAILLLGILTTALYHESRLASVEQAVTDLKAQVAVLEQRVDTKLYGLP